MNDGDGGAGAIICVSSDNDFLIADDSQSEVIAYAGLQFAASKALQTETVAFVLALSMLIAYFSDGRRVLRIPRFS